MQQFKYTLTAFTTLALLASFPAHAMKEFGILITGGASYMLPTQNDLDYLDLQTEGYVRTRALEPLYSWGYYLGAGYAINKDYDVQASWAQFDSNVEDNTVSVGEIGGVIQYSTSNGALIPLPVDTLLRATTTNVLNTGILDFNVGQTHPINEGLRARYFVGIRYARIADEVSNVYEDSALTEGPFDHYESTFNGVGPEAGFEMGIDFHDTPYDPIGLIGGLGFALLVGDLEAHSEVDESARPILRTTMFRFLTPAHVEADPNSTVIVPNIYAKLGLKWGLIEGGWQVSYFHNAVDQLQYSHETGLKHNRSSVTIQGAYFNMSAKI